MKLDFQDHAFRTAVLELIRRASTDLAPDVVRAIQTALENEDDGSAARGVLSAILKNIERAREKSTPICQDTGTNIYEVSLLPGVSMRRIEKLIREATREATEKVYLRPNAVDPVTGKNSGDNTGELAPYIHFVEWDVPAIGVKLLLKGGGCENVSTQYTLPDITLKAGRDLEGVYKTVVDAVVKAQGRGCAPGILGVGVGGDRSSGMMLAKKQLFRRLDDIHPDPELARLESRLLKDLNTLGIGPMGFGGKTTALAVKIGVAHRLPASYFVSVAYMCWADRKHSMRFSPDEVIYD
ncbi:TPA: fumarate hydratase [Candidatus Marinimicrobia bacterium]|nr:MAG: Fumarate hydratase, class I, alpha subunit [Marinimicrobia bacterium 46_47]KUK91629.1 MAG: fumarate hydratase class I subunit alpha [Marinimicrobia bacterium 46_43]HAE87852.1 fumarate hydratase [Candidatus Neomarinimicrobiota bacterium]HBY18601.1 fumarate hydratase [Candidatus Neomarinimicrobiota bacterium]